MLNHKRGFLLLCLPLFSCSTDDEVGFDSGRSNALDDELGFASSSPNTADDELGFASSGSRTVDDEVGFARTSRTVDEDLGFFEILNGSVSASERPYSFGEMIVLSSVIGRGYFADVIPGRTILNTTMPPSFPPKETVLLKITTLNVLKGDYQPSFYVEYPVGKMVIGRLREKIYTGELLFFLQPAHHGYRREEAEVSISREAELVLGDQPIYELTLYSTLFTMSPENRLTTPLGHSRQLDDLYSNIMSLEELQSRIEAIQSSGECEPVVLDYC